MNFSLNTVKISEVPEYFSLKSLKGKNGFDAFSSGTICKIIKINADKLHIERNCELPKALSCCLNSTDMRIKSMAESLVDEFGRRLALVLYNAKKFSCETKNIKDNKDAEKFLKCNKILVGGGLASGKLGQGIIKSANDLLKQSGQELTLETFAFPEYMPLIGCSSLAPNGKSIVFDFGQTYIKSAVCCISNGNIEKLIVNKKIESRYVERKYAFNFIKAYKSEKLDKYIKKYILDIINKNKEMQLSNKIIISFAGKSENNELLPYGAYGKLEAVFGGYRENLESFISEKTNRDAEIILMGDEKAAALSANNFDGLVMTLGTAFGLCETQYNKGLNICDKNKTSILKTDL